jgi:site-specific recombinase XerD
MSEITISSGNCPVELAELAELEAETLDYIAQSKAHNTVKSYNSDWSDFETWANGRGLETRPARAETVALYISHMARSGQKVSTIQRRLVAFT